MSKNNHTTKGKRFKHLTKEKRAQIEILLKQGVSKTEIAKIIGISRSTLYNELNRGTVEQIDTNLNKYKRYFYDVGQRVYEEHRQNSRPALKLIKAYEFIKYAEEKMLVGKLCPDAICGEARISGNFNQTVCTKTLYNYIDAGLLKVRNIDLPLRVKRKQKRDVARKSRRIFGMSIDERPAEINDRVEFGHWEFDTVIGKKEASSVFLTLDEMVTRYRHIIKTSSRTAEAVGEGILKLQSMYGDNFSLIFKSITCDNGNEFARLSQQLPETKIYYAHPYSSFERGTNEKQNSLIRRFFPKGKSFDDISDETVAFVEIWINNLPRKIFNYRSAFSLFSDVLFDVAI